MPYPPERRQQTRARIIRSAQALFNRHGFTGISIDDVMKHAGLTRGGFYSYFRTKSELYAEAVALYLSRQHLHDVEGSCPMVTLPGDVARSDATVRGAFESVFNSMAGLFEESLKREGRADRGRALAIAGLCVGAMIVARSVSSAKLADAIRAAARSTALELGRWSEDATTDGRRLGSASRTPGGRRPPARKTSASPR